jgi:hypothetical protein
MGLDASYFRASGVRFIAAPFSCRDDQVTTALRVRSQYANVIAKSRTWIVALCKTSGGLFYSVDGAEMVVFPDNSYLTITRDTVIDILGQWPEGYVEKYASAFQRIFV